MAVTLYHHPASICSQMARVVLAEKGVDYERHTIDITGGTQEQFEPWYLTLNPRGVVPTLQHNDQVVTDTLRISRYIDATFDGPALTPAHDGANEAWMAAIMAPHYGVLLYAPLVDETGRCATIEARGVQLRALREARPEQAELLDRRIAGNARFQKILADPEQWTPYVEACRALVQDMEGHLQAHPFLVDDVFRIADAFAAAALARFEAHGHATWWQDGALPAVAAYYERLQARPSWAAAGVLNRDLGWHG